MKRKSAVLFPRGRSWFTLGICSMLAACGGDRGMAPGSGITAAAGPVGCYQDNSRSEPASSPDAAAIVSIACDAMVANGLKAAIMQVTVDGKVVLRQALGESSPGVPASTAMHFRNGAVAMTYMATVLLQLVDEQKVRLADKVGTWLPDLPAADKVTLEMLANHTSGYPDYEQDAAFTAAADANPDRAWTADELLSYALGKQMLYEPGANWNYAHTNYLILGRILEKVSGQDLATLIRERIVSPLGLANTASFSTPYIPPPVLHGYTAIRGSYEEATYWNPSWTLPPGAVMSTDIADLATTAAAISTGRLLSPQSHAAQGGPKLIGHGDPTACPPGICRKNTEKGHFGLGLLISGPWLLQTALFSGYSAAIGMLPGKMEIVVAATQGPDAIPSRNGSETLLYRISSYIAPNDPIPLASSIP
jgi:CubicO group peptidase (beta-lactamase class C family)